METSHWKRCPGVPDVAITGVSIATVLIAIHCDEKVLANVPKPSH